MRFPLSILPNTVKATAESRVGFSRLNAFFSMPEISERRKLSGNASKKIAVKVSSASFEYDQPIRNYAAMQRKLNPDGKKMSKRDLAAATAIQQKIDEEAEDKRFSLRDLSFKVKRGEARALLSFCSVVPLNCHQNNEDFFCGRTT